MTYDGQRKRLSEGQSEQRHSRGGRKKVSSWKAEGMNTSWGFRGVRRQFLDVCQVCTHVACQVLCSWIKLVVKQPTVQVYREVHTYVVQVGTVYVYNMYSR